jgi:hypothetical protein
MLPSQFPRRHHAQLPYPPSLAAPLAFCSVSHILRFIPASSPSRAYLVVFVTLNLALLFNVVLQIRNFVFFWISFCEKIKSLLIFC